MSEEQDKVRNALLDVFKDWIASDVDREIMKHLKDGTSTSWSSTAGTSSSDFTLEKLQEMFESLQTVKRIVIFFNPWVDKVLYGPMIDRLLDCKENEEGFIVPEYLRNFLYEHRGYYEERSPGISPFRIEAKYRFW